MPRSPAESPDYSPAWRHELLQRIVLQVTGDANQPSAVEKILAKERDFYVRELVRHEFNLSCRLSMGLDYAFACQATRMSNRSAAIIRAMTVAGCDASEIAREIGTALVNVRIYQKVFWDVAPYLTSRSWLKMLCSSQARQSEPEYLRVERRWLQLALQGWPVLAQVISPRRSIKPQSGLDQLTELLRMCLCRAADFGRQLEYTGLSPAIHDVHLLSAVLKEAKALGFQGIGLSELEYPKPLSPKDEEAAKLIGKLSSTQRRRLGTFIQCLKSELQKNPSPDSNQQPHAGN